jgi:hypothetical protein
MDLFEVTVIAGRQLVAADANGKDTKRLFNHVYIENVNNQININRFVRSICESDSWPQRATKHCSGEITQSDLESNFLCV